jgi:hypothetical protein
MASAGAKGKAAPKDVNVVHQDEIWRQHVRREELTVKTFDETWGYLKGSIDSQFMLTKVSLDHRTVSFFSGIVFWLTVLHVSRALLLQRRQNRKNPASLWLELAKFRLGLLRLCFVR